VEQACPVVTPSSDELSRLSRLYERNPTSTLFARLADVHLALGDVEGAIRVCRKGLRYRPSYVTGHLVLGRAYLTFGDARRAEDEYQKVLRLEPDNPAATRYLASIAEADGDEVRARYLWDRLRVLHPFHPALQRSAPTPEPEETPEAAGEDLACSNPERQEKDEEAFPFVSMTLAKLYARQGHRGRAEQVARLVDPAYPEDRLGELVNESTS